MTLRLTSSCFGINHGQPNDQTLTKGCVGDSDDLFLSPSASVKSTQRQPVLAPRSRGNPQIASACRHNSSIKWDQFYEYAYISKKARRATGSRMPATVLRFTTNHRAPASGRPGAALGFTRWLQPVPRGIRIAQRYCIPTLPCGQSSAPLRRREMKLTVQNLLFDIDSTGGSALVFALTVPRMVFP
jgi:hypothetical protein